MNKEKKKSAKKKKIIDGDMASSMTSEQFSHAKKEPADSDNKSRDGAESVGSIILKGEQSLAVQSNDIKVREHILNHGSSVRPIIEADVFSEEDD